MSSAREDAALGWTSHYTAAVWASLGVPGSERFATWQGRALDRAIRWGSGALGFRGDHSVANLMLAARHLGLSALLRERAPEQVIELAAGLSPRGLAWARAHAGAYIEIDQPAVIARKRRLVAGVPARGALHLVAADLRRGALVEALVGLVRDVPTAIVCEGLTGYLDEPSLRAFLRQVRALATRPRSCVVLIDVYLRHDLARAGERAPRPAWLFRRALRGVLRHALRDTDRVRALVAEEGFELRAAHGARELARRVGIAPPPIELFAIAELVPARSSGDGARASSMR